MYLPINQGKRFNIQGLECWIPQPGYVFDITTGKEEYIGIWQRSDIKEQQYWERTPLPAWYKIKIKEEDAYEKNRKDGQPPYYDEQLDKYVSREWSRRLNGFWFMNNGEPIYITGAHYMYLQWWQIDIGYPKFRYPDLEYFYFQQYCIEDINCLGMIEICKRRFGKTFRAGLFLYEYVTRTKMANGGIQSKTGSDAKKVFAKAVVNPFKKLPRFFRPEYDMSLGITPKTELRFQQTNVRGKKAEEIIEKDELGSLIDFQSADVVAYDGNKLHRYVGDETAKTVEANVYDRHNVIRYCLLDDEGKIIGKALYCTTVEKMETDNEGVQKAFKDLWNDSDQNNRKENGRTPSGLYRFFMTADRGRNFDIYGVPNVEKTVSEIISDRKAIEHNRRALSAIIRKEARTIKEAFLTDGDKCLFDEISISEQLEWLSYNKMTERGNLVWKDGHEYFIERKDTGGNIEYEPNKLVWVANKNGEYEKVIGWLPKEMNNVVILNGTFRPNGNYSMRIGADPFKFDKTKSSIKSDGVAYGFQMDDETDKGNPYSEMFTICYADRAMTAEIQYDRMLKLAWFCGCQILFERNVYEWKRYFMNKKCGSFLMWLPNELEPGIFTGGNADNGTVQLIADQINSYADVHVKRVYFEKLLGEEKGWLGLRVEETQPFDHAMSSGITLIAAKSKKYMRSSEIKKDIEKILPYNKAI